MKYKSPIVVSLTEEIVDCIAEDIHRQIADQTYQAVCNVGITVDKDELERALRHDRRQYEAGWRDAKINTLAEIKAQCLALKNCKNCEFHGQNMDCRLASYPDAWDL